MTHSSKAHLALLGTNIFFAINYTAIKYTVDSGLAKPFGLNFVRVSVTAILLWVIFLFGKQKLMLQRKDVGRFILCALTGIAINQLLFVKGLVMTLSIHASLLMLTTPIVITLIAAWFLGEKLTAYKIAGLSFGIAGAVILVSARDQGGSANDIFLGDILIIINAISYSVYFILVKPLMMRYNPVMVIRMVFTIGCFMILPFCWTEFVQIPWHQYQATDFGILFIIVFAGTFLAYLFNVYGIRHLGAAVSGNYIYSQPLFAAVIAMVFLGEKLNLYKLIAAVCIFMGVYLASKSRTNG